MKGTSLPPSAPGGGGAGVVADGSPVHDEALYEIRKKVYPRAVTGKFATSRWAFVILTQLVFYGMPWLVWNDRQGVLFDLANR